MSDMKYVRKAIEDTYIGTCDVIEYRKTRNEENKQNEYSEEVVLSNKKCRLSLKQLTILIKHLLQTMQYKLLNYLLQLS